MKTDTEEKSIVEFVPFGTKDKIILSIEIVKRLVAVKTRTGKNCSDEDAFRFMLMCQARKLNPFEGDAYLVGFDSSSGGPPSFSLITAHQAFLKRAELHPEYDGMDSGTIVLRKGEIIDLVGDWHMPEDRILGGWATVFFKDRSHPTHKRVRLERFAKNYGIWKDDPAGMIVKCAEADALRSSFPTMLGGLYTNEEIDVRTSEIPRPVFDGTTVTVNGGPEPVLEPQPRIEEPKKKPTLKRKSVARSTAELAPAQPKQGNREKLVLMLGLGNCTPQDFIDVALDQGWIALDQATLEKIPEERITEMLQPENWTVVMDLLDEKRAKVKATGITKGGDLL